MTLTLTIPGRIAPVTVADFAEASATYTYYQEVSGEGGSTFPGGVIHRDDGTIAGRVSYNGRVFQGDVLTYCPHSAPVDQGRPDIFNEGRESVWGRKIPNPYAAKSYEWTIFELGAEIARRSYAQVA